MTCYTLINAGKHQNRTPKNTISSWLLSCTCYLLRCKCRASLRPNILCVHGTTCMAQLPISPNPNLKFTIVEFTYYNIKSRKNTSKLQHTPTSTNPTRIDVLPPKIITFVIRGSIHNATTKLLMDLKSPKIKIKKLMKTFS